MINIAILGYGTVGSGVFGVIRTNQAIVDKNAGEEIRVKYVLDLRDFPGDPVEEVLTHDYETILQDEEVKIVVEVMGGLKPAYDFVKRALQNGKSVCTSNKELVANYGPELLRTARENRVNFLFEASCGGGIPIIRPLQTSLTADRIEEISGILNGTTNYILTKMKTEGLGFEEALKSAQENGFAERDPSADIEGGDACRKIAILSSLAYGKTLDFKEIPTEGITKITHKDIELIEELGYAVKLIATCFSVEGKSQTDTEYHALVAPMLVNKEHPLYSINGVFNAVLVKGNMLGDTMYYGRGAGKYPTASAVVSDVIAAAGSLEETLPVRCTEEKLTLSDNGSLVRSFYVRAEGKFAERLSEVEKLFGKPVRTVEAGDEFCFITPPVSEKEFTEAYGKLSKAVNWIRLV